MPDCKDNDDERQARVDAIIEHLNALKIEAYRARECADRGRRAAEAAKLLRAATRRKIAALEIVKPVPVQALSARRRAKTKA